MKLKRKNTLAIMIPIASMGDIAFLLIIFFMLASNLVKEAHIEYTPPISPDIEDMEQLQVSVTIDEDGIIYLQGEETPVQALESMVGAMIENRDEKRVFVQIDENIPEEVFGPVLIELSKAEALPVLTGTLTGKATP